MAETVWVLDRAYGLSSPEISAAVERMHPTDVLIVENEEEVLTAMLALRSGEGSFADALVGALGTRAGCVVNFRIASNPVRPVMPTNRELPEH